MCGILGICFQNGCTLTNHSLARYMLRELFIEVEIRGQDSSGVAFVNNREIAVFKAPVAAGDFITTKEFNKYNLEYLNLRERTGTISVMGHCRSKTKGTPLNNNNNHPIVTDNVVGVHNGEISNDDDLFSRFAHVDRPLFRRARVDSEIIFRLIDYFSDARGANTAEAIKQMSELVEGSYVCAMVERRNPYLVWLFRKLGPLTVRHYQDSGVIVYASGSSFIDNAMQGMGLEDELGNPDIITVPKFSGVCINLFSNSIKRFYIKDKNEEHFQPWC